MILKKPFIYYYQKPEFKTVHDKQQEHNKENCRFSFRDTFNIYKYKYEVWEIFSLI